MATQYRVKYAILPAGVGPDDYESSDLEHGELVLELSDPEPAGVTFGGKEMTYGPHLSEVQQAVTTALDLKEGDEPIILSWNAV
jgi:hypothetical protein